MNPWSRSTPSNLVRWAGSMILFAALAIAGCSDNKNPLNPNPNPGTGSTTYSGTIAGSTTSGSLTLTVATTTPAPQQAGYRASAIVTASGTLVLTGGGGTVNLTGNYDTGTHLIGVTGGGWTLDGGLTTFGMEGNYSGPGGVTGVFSVQTQGSGANVVGVYVGTFTSTSGGTSGNFNFSIKGSVLHGNAVDANGTVVALDGQYTAETGGVTVVHPAGGAPLATGTILPNGTASGTYDDRNGNSGNWSGTKQP